MVKRFDHSPTIIRKNIFDRSYRIRREQSLSRRFIVIHIPSIFPVPIFLFLRRVTLSPIAQRGQTITKVRFIRKGRGEKKKNTRYTSRRWDLRVGNNETRRIYRKRRCCSILVTSTARRAPPFLFFILSFFLPFSSSLPFFFFSSTPLLFLEHALSMFLSRN